MVSGKEIWSVTGQKYYSAICSDANNIYMVDNGYNKDICSYSHSGKLLWDVSPQKVPDFATPIICDADYIYIINTSNNIWWIEKYTKSGVYIESSPTFPCFYGPIQLAVDDSNLYVAFHSNGLYRVDKATYTCTRINVSGLTSSIRGVMCDADNLYICALTSDTTAVVTCVSKSDFTTKKWTTNVTASYEGYNFTIGLFTDGTNIYTSTFNNNSSVSIVTIINKSGIVLNSITKLRSNGENFLNVDDNSVYFCSNYNVIASNKLTFATILTYTGDGVVPIALTSYGKYIYVSYNTLSDSTKKFLRCIMK